MDTQNTLLMKNTPISLDDFKKTLLIDEVFTDSSIPPAAFDVFTTSEANS